MVRKGFARLVIQDCLRERQQSHESASTSIPTEQNQPEYQPASSKAADGQIPGSEPSRRQSLDGRDQMGASAKNRLMNGDASIEPSKGHDAHSDFSNEKTAIDQSLEHRKRAWKALRETLDNRLEAEHIDVLDKELEKVAMEASSEQFEQMALPGMMLGVECGNMYAGRLHTGSKKFWLRTL